MAAPTKSKRRKQAPTFVNDGLINTMSGAGTAADKSSFGRFVKVQRSYDELSQLYSSTAIARKVVDIIPGDMTREWRSLEDSGLDANQIERFELEETRLDIRRKVRRALKFARLHGGALLIPIIENGDPDLRQPININSVKKGMFRGLNVVEAEFAPAAGVITQDPTSPNYLMPEFYSITGATNTQLPHSRVIRFDGLELPRREFMANRWWHQSVLDSVYNDLSNAILTSNSIAGLMHEINLDIVSVKGLSNALATGQESQIKKRFETMAFIKSMYHMTVMDADEEFNSRTAPAAGLGDLIDKFYGILSAVSGVPATRFMGESPGGLNATGTSDLKNYYDEIKDKQVCELGPALSKIDELVSRSIWGEPNEDVHSYTWNPLEQESQLERATREFTDAQRDQIYLQNGVITEAQVATELQQGKVFTSIDDKHIAELEAALSEDDFNEEDEALLNGSTDTDQTADTGEQEEA